jgi:ATP-dependent DNA helicase RecG
MLPSTILHQKPGPHWAFVPDADVSVIAETLVAFANSDGGTLVLGVNAEGRLGTIFTTEEASDALIAAQRLCRPPVPTQWQPQEPVPGGAIVLLRIDRSGEIHSLDDGRILLRKGSDNLQPDGVELDRLMAGRPAGDFEAQPVAGATREDLDEDVIKDYLERRQARNPRHTILPKDKLLQQIGALSEDSHAHGEWDVAVWQGAAAFLAAMPGNFCKIC